MATSLVEIEEYLSHQELRFKVDVERDHVLTGFAMEHYLDKDGDHHLQIVIKLEEEGEFIKIFTPKCYQYLGEHKAILFQVLLMVSWKTKMIQFEYDQSDGEVRAVIEFPLEDSPLTENQLMRAVISLAQIVDRYHRTIQMAMDEGDIQFEANQGETQMMDMLRKMTDVSEQEEQTALDDKDEDDSDDMEFI